MLSARSKQFLRTWLIPPGVIEARRRRLDVPATLQKMWVGAPVAAPPLEATYFSQHQLDAVTLTRDDDSRACARVTRTVALSLPPSTRGAACQFALLADADWTDEIRVVCRASAAVVMHRRLSARRWLDVRLDVPADATHLEIAPQLPVHVTMPRAVATARSHDSGVRHVVLLVLDGWSQKLMSDVHPTEPSLPLTPNIDRFFACGLEATRGYSSGEWTLPTVASLFTGLGTTRHHFYRPYVSGQLPGDRVLLAEHFQRAGFHTVAFSPANRVTPAYGHHRGFDRFIYHWPAPGRTSRDYDPAIWMNEVAGHLDVHRYDRTFTYVHLPDTHPAWHIPPLTRSFNLQRRGDSTGHDLEALAHDPAAAEQGRQLNLLRLHELDRTLGGVFDLIERNLRDDTVVVLTADHGTPWEHVRARRPIDEPYLVDDRTGIVLKMRGAGIPRRQYHGLVAPNIDLLPTLLALAGIEAPPDLDGRDLLDPAYRRDRIVSESVFGGKYEIAARDQQYAYFEKYPFDESSGVITGPRIYAALFPRGAEDYSVPLAHESPELESAVRAHMERVGLAAGAGAL
jgi:hypothetical protein